MFPKKTQPTFLAVLQRISWAFDLIEGVLTLIFTQGDEVWKSFSIFPWIKQYSLPDVDQVGCGYDPGRQRSDRVPGG